MYYENLVRSPKLNFEGTACTLRYICLLLSESYCIIVPVPMCIAYKQKLLLRYP